MKWTSTSTAGHYGNTTCLNSIVSGTLFTTVSIFKVQSNLIANLLCLSVICVLCKFCQRRNRNILSVNMNRAFLKRYGGLTALGVALYTMNLCHGWNLVFLMLLAWISFGGYHTLYLMYHTLWRDLRYKPWGFLYIGICVNCVCI